jgi:DNA-binding NtrC family response regulator
VPTSILLAQDDPALAEALSIFLQGRGFECATARDASTAVRLLSHAKYDLLLCPTDLEGSGGPEFTRRLANEFPGTAVLRLDADPGASARPFQYESLLQQIRRILAERPPSEEREPRPRGLRRPSESQPLIGRSARMKAVFDMIQRLSGSTSTVLLTGESGTGKEVAARTLHEACALTRGQKFVPINCAAIPATLLESELFGHVRGAFTGATAEKRGLFEMAEGGSLFLDEIGELDAGLQAKLLRAIDRKEILRVGGVNPIRLDARIICATNRDLKELMARRLFREDLFYRISVVEVRLAPLRERPEDIPELAAHFIERLNRELRRDYQGVEPDAMEALGAYAWPGNVRELQNVIERAMILREGRTVGVDDLPAHIARAAARAPKGLREALRAFERDHIRSVLEESGLDREKAARRLGIGVSSLYRKMRALNLSPAPRD